MAFVQAVAFAVLALSYVRWAVLSVRRRRWLRGPWAASPHVSLGSTWVSLLWLFNGAMLSAHLAALWSHGNSAGYNARLGILFDVNEPVAMFFCLQLPSTLHELHLFSRHVFRLYEEPKTRRLAWAWGAAFLVAMALVVAIAALPPVTKEESAGALGRSIRSARHSWAS